MGRMLIAIMDNYQQADGSVKVPGGPRADHGQGPAGATPA